MCKTLTKFVTKSHENSTKIVCEIVTYLIQVFENKTYSPINKANKSLLQIIIVYFFFFILIYIYL